MPSADKAEMMRYLSDISGLGSTAIKVKSIDAKFNKQANDNHIQPTTKVDKKLMGDIHTFAINSLSHQTPSSPVKSYLTNIRGYGIEDLKKMELGKYLKSLNWSDAKIKEAYKALNYIGQTHKLVIPFKDSKGETIGFAGRNIDYKETDTIGKYLYTKGLSRSGTLANAHNLNEKKSAVIVEGLLDSLSAQAKGIENVVSLGGTAFNKSQLALLQDKGVQSITLCLDNDKAGKEASNRIKEIIQHSKAEMRIKEVTLPNNIKDPDQMIKEQGATAFSKSIADAKEFTSNNSIPSIQQQNSNTFPAAAEKIKDEEFSI